MNKLVADLLNNLEEMGISVLSFSRETGISADRVYQWKSGRGNPKQEDSEIIQNWLSDKPVSRERSPSITHAPKGRLSRRAATDGGLIKFFDVDFAAGDIAFFDESAMVQPAYTMDIPEFSGCTAFRVYGDSMEDLIKSGSIVFATQVVDWHDHLEYGQIYGIICSDKRRYLKYIRRIKGKESHFLLKSANEELYDDFEIPKNKIKSIWLIHGWINRRT